MPLSAARNQRLMRLTRPTSARRRTGPWSILEGAGAAEYVEGFSSRPGTSATQAEGSNADPDENDPMFDDAVRLVFEFAKASTSLCRGGCARLRPGSSSDRFEWNATALSAAQDGSRARAELLKAPGWLHEVARDEQRLTRWLSAVNLLLGG